MDTKDKLRINIKPYKKKYIQKLIREEIIEAIPARTYPVMLECE